MLTAASVVAGVVLPIALIPVSTLPAKFAASVTSRVLGNWLRDALETLPHKTGLMWLSVVRDPQGAELDSADSWSRVHRKTVWPRIAGATAMLASDPRLVPDPTSGSNAHLGKSFHKAGLSGSQKFVEEISTWLVSHYSGHEVGLKRQPAKSWQELRAKCADNASLRVLVGGVGDLVKLLEERGIGRGASAALFQTAVAVLGAVRELKSLVRQASDIKAGSEHPVSQRALLCGMTAGLVMGLSAMGICVGLDMQASVTIAVMVSTSMLAGLGVGQVLDRNVDDASDTAREMSVLAVEDAGPAPGSISDDKQWIVDRLGQAGAEFAYVRNGERRTIEVIRPATAEDSPVSLRSAEGVADLFRRIDQDNPGTVALQGSRLEVARALSRIEGLHAVGARPAHPEGRDDAFSMTASRRDDGSGWDVKHARRGHEERRDAQRDAGRGPWKGLSLARSQARRSSDVDGIPIRRLAMESLEVADLDSDPGPSSAQVMPGLRHPSAAATRAIELPSLPTCRSAALPGDEVL